MNRLKHYQSFHYWYEAAAIFFYFLITSNILASSIVMEGWRNGHVPEFGNWEPFVWEYSSAISWIILLFPLLKLLKKWPWQWHNLSKSLVVYFSISVLLSLAHVSLMVGFRKLIYWSIGMDYDFGEIGYELIYEYRKDLWSFVFILMIFHGYGFIRSRLLGEANLLAKSDDDSLNDSERLLVKKLGKEFIIKVADIEWLESSGNYVNLHLEGRIYPVRSTLSQLVEQISKQGFCRVHRCYAVNLDAIESISNMNSGDGEIMLKGGKALSLSRRYRDQFKQRLQ